MTTFLAILCRLPIPQRSFTPISTTPVLAIAHERQIFEFARHRPYPFLSLSRRVPHRCRTPLEKMSTKPRTLFNPLETMYVSDHFQTTRLGDITTRIMNQATMKGFHHGLASQLNTVQQRELTRAALLILPRPVDDFGAQSASVCSFPHYLPPTYQLP